MYPKINWGVKRKQRLVQKKRVMGHNTFKLLMEVILITLFLLTRKFCIVNNDS